MDSFATSQGEPYKHFDFAKSMARVTKVWTTIPADASDVHECAIEITIHLFLDVVKVG